MISRVISTLNGVTLIITLLITGLLSPLGLQVRVSGFRVFRLGLRFKNPHGGLEGFLGLAV